MKKTFVLAEAEHLLLGSEVEQGERIPADGIIKGIVEAEARIIELLQTAALPAGAGAVGAFTQVGTVHKVIACGEEG